MKRRTLLFSALAVYLTKSVFSSLSQASGKARYVVVRKWVSKIHPDKHYKTKDEFWADHFNPVGARINSIFRFQGLVLYQNSYMEPCGKILVQEKHFPNLQAYHLIEELKSSSSKQDRKLAQISIEERFQS